MRFSLHELGEIRKNLIERKIVLLESKAALERDEFRALFGDPEEPVEETITNLEEQIQDVDAAERRLEMGTYGTCEKCEVSLSAHQLYEVPEARLCLRCFTASLKLNG
jgi:RNA polymerase-binding transcription factor DksA